MTSFMAAKALADVCEALMQIELDCRCWRRSQGATMAFHLEKAESVYRKWYLKHKERLSAKRKKLYAENPEYRERALEASKKYRDTGSAVAPMPNSLWCK
jgi:hypothetical protein